MRISVVCAATWNHVDFRGPCGHRQHVGDHSPDGAGGFVDLHSPSYHNGHVDICSLVLPPKVMLKSMAGLLWGWRPWPMLPLGLWCCPWPMLQWGSCWYLWSTLLPETMMSPKTMWKSHCRQGRYFCSDINDYRLTVEKVRHKRLLWHLYHHPNQPNMQPR